MTFDDILDQAIAPLQRRGRLTYPTLKRQFPHSIGFRGYPETWLGKKADLLDRTGCEFSVAQKLLVLAPV